MNRRPNIIFVLLLFATAFVSINYYTALHLNIGSDGDESFSPPQIEVRHSQHIHTHHSNLSTRTSPHNQRNTPTADNPNTIAKIDLATIFNFTIPIHNSKKDDPFAPQERTGQVWTSPHKNQTNGNQWWKYSDTCFAVDDICRFSQNRWFYIRDTRPLGWQPTLELKYMPYSYSPKTWADTRIQMTVQASHKISWEKLVTTNQCDVSMVPYHVILQSNYNVSPPSNLRSAKYITCCLPILTNDCRMCALIRI
jgi:hypothetical protein